jgi:hypothetical protein
VQVAVRVDARESKTWEGMAIGLTKKRIMLVKTRYGYNGESSRGVRIGTDALDVEKKYGKASYAVSDQSGVFLVFREPAIIFHAGPDSKITAWILFSGD